MADDSRARSRGADKPVTRRQRQAVEVTDEVMEATSEGVSEFEQLLIDEIQARPLRALSWAAAAGVLLGFWAAR